MEPISKAGRELDALVAEKLGLPYYDGHYSTDIAAAWEVVTYLETYANDHKMLLTVEYSGGTWECRLEKWDKYECEKSIDSGWVDTAPLAICLAALLTKGIQYV